MTEDFITLEEYAKCVQRCLENILHDHQMAEDEKPKVIYANAPIAWAKAQEHFANGSNVGPLITFYQSGIEVNHDVQMGAWKILPVQRNEGNYLFKAPIICKINYTVTINALTELQADLLQVQIMQSTPFHRPYYTKFNGQFVLIESTDYRNLSTVDSGENKDKIAQREIVLTINRAYLYYDIKELNAGIIHPNMNDSSSSYDELSMIDILKDMFSKDEPIFDKEGNRINIADILNKELIPADSSYEGTISINNPLYDINGKRITVESKLKEDRKVVERLRNGEVIYDDGTTSGIVEKNTSLDGFSPFNYNVADENGKIIDVAKKGKLKVTLYSLEGIKK